MLQRVAGKVGGTIGMMEDVAAMNLAGVSGLALQTWEQCVGMTAKQSQRYPVSTITCTLQVSRPPAVLRITPSLIPLQLLVTSVAPKIYLGLMGPSTVPKRKSFLYVNSPHDLMA
jgi:hypothetical protein